MFFTKFRSAVILVSLLGSAGLWILGIVQIPAGRSSRYGTLVVDEEIPDREICRRLESRGLSGLVSESGQWFLLDCFGGVEQIPLDEYDTRLLSFDPRNDGYAEKLRSLFVQDGKRAVYVPLGIPAQTNKKIAAALEDIPYSFAYGRRGISPGFLLFLFCLACGAFVVVRPLRKTLMPDAAFLVPCLPPLSPLVLAGAAGFALAALLAGLAVYLAGPYKPVKQRWLLPSIFTVCFFLVAFLAGIPVLFTLSAPALFACVLALSLRNAPHRAANVPIRRTSFSLRRINARNTAKGKRGRPLSVRRRDIGHSRFAPVSIMGRQRGFNISFSWAMIPFAALSLVLALIGLASPVSAAGDPSFVPPANGITREDYEDHVFFQSTFSLRTLHADGDAGMSYYRLAPDGLVDLVLDDDFENGDLARSIFPLPTVPHFPIGGFLRELGRKNGGTGRSGIPEMILALVPLLFIIPCLIVSPYSDILIHNSHESIFVPPGRAFLRRSHRST